MSTANKPTTRMTTRGGAKEKMAEMVALVKSCGMVKENSRLRAPRGDTTVVPANGEGTPQTPEIQKTNNTTRAAKKNTSKKGSTVTTKKGKGTKKDSTSKEDKAAAKKELASKLAKLEDKQVKAHEIARSSHPRQWTGEGPGNHVLIASLTTGRLIASPQNNALSWKKGLSMMVFTTEAWGSK